MIDFMIKFNGIAGLDYLSTGAAFIGSWLYLDFIFGSAMVKSIIYSISELRWVRKLAAKMDRLCKVSKELKHPLNDLDFVFWNII